MGLESEEEERAERLFKGARTRWRWEGLEMSGRGAYKGPDMG